MAAQTEAIANRSAARSPWIYRPWIDLLVGCGGWSAPLLAVALWLTPSHTHAWAVAFYFLAVLFNYPHFMATIYRAYRTREDFEKYKLFTLHMTVLVVLTGVLLHAFYPLLPWVFTLYICWSPWHYTGQNYGLLLMFVRRSGSSVTNAERRSLRAAFIASYLMLLASFETGGSADPLILSLGWPAKFTLPIRLSLGLSFLLFSALAFRRLVAASGVRAMAAPLTLAFTQFLWFVLPTLLELHADYQIPQTRYSSGILAVLHSTQYIWITSYYQQRQERTAGGSGWRMSAYWLTLVAGGIALFIPGPWLVSYVFHFDFTTSFLIFLSLINIHHFLLDGALWKLRDARIASFLLDPAKVPSQANAAAQSPAQRPPRRINGLRRLIPAPVFRFALATVLFLWGGMDQIHFVYRTAEGSLPALRTAERINPYDSLTEERIAAAEGQTGHLNEAIGALGRAVSVNPQNRVLQQEYARALIRAGRYPEAYEHYRQMLAIFPGDPDALVNYGLLASHLGHPQQALESWEKALVVDPNQTNAHLYLAQAFDQNHDLAAAARHWSALLIATSHSESPLSPEQRVSALIRFGDDEAALARPSAALAAYESALDLAERSGYRKLTSLALAHLAEQQDQTGRVALAAQSYQRALSLDAFNRDSSSAAADWFNYGQFLRRHSVADDLVYACFLKAEQLLVPNADKERETVRRAGWQLEARLGRKAATVQKDLDNEASRALALSFE